MLEAVPKSASNLSLAVKVLYTPKVLEAARVDAAAVASAADLAVSPEKYEPISVAAAGAKNADGDAAVAIVPA